MRPKKPSSNGSAARLGTFHQRCSVIETVETENKEMRIDNYEIQRPIT